MATNQIERYVYDTRVGRYRDLQTGRLVSERFVEDVIEGRIEAGRQRMADFADAVMTGQTSVSIADWQTAMAIELRNMHVQMTVLGAGGRDNVTQADWGRLGRRLRDEYRYLARFAAQIASGQVSEAQMLARMDMYANAIWSSYWKTKTAQNERNGYTEERRIINAAAESCPDCIAYAAEGWRPIGTLPAPGEGSRCLSRCRCTKAYRR